MNFIKRTHAPSRLQYKRLLGAIMVSGFLNPTAHAQGGPPFITDDPGTPGANNWEINAAVIGAQSHQHWDLAAPDLDINYGWGEHVQLKVDVNWASTLASDGRLISGFGATDFGVKWRFVDQGKSGFALSVYPQLGRLSIRCRTGPQFRRTWTRCLDWWSNRGTYLRTWTSMRCRTTQCTYW
jgi:hypothetical protein